jgi:hypothetical protein
MMFQVASYRFQVVRFPKITRKNKIKGTSEPAAKSQLPEARRQKKKLWAVG